VAQRQLLPEAARQVLDAVGRDGSGFGGETEFADLRMAYDALPDWRKSQIEACRRLHYALHSRFLLGDTNYTEEQRRASRRRVAAGADRSRARAARSCSWASTPARSRA
jgi:hypothetical protein